MRGLRQSVVLIGLLVAAPALSATEILIYGFEETPDGWKVPDWAKSSPDYVAEECLVSEDHAREGRRALELRASFPAEGWAGAYIEREIETTDWSAFGHLMVDMYLPDGAPKGLGAKIVLTVGDQWQWTEMNRVIPLQPGVWTTVAVNLKPGSLDWKFFPTDAFRKDIRKFGIRIESNNGPAYHGSVFLDNVRLVG